MAAAAGTESFAASPPLVVVSPPAATVGEEGAADAADAAAELLDDPYPIPNQPPKRFATFRIRSGCGCWLLDVADDDAAAAAGRGGENADSTSSSGPRVAGDGDATDEVEGVSGTSRCCA